MAVLQFMFIHEGTTLAFASCDDLEAGTLVESGDAIGQDETGHLRV
jgi:hypothetical protein